MSEQKTDMTKGPLLGKIIVFILPMIFTNLLQVLYNMADMFVAGRFLGSHALAGIGATSYLTTLITNFVIGLSVGVSTVIAQTEGAGDKKSVSSLVHSSLYLSIIVGVSFGILGFLSCRNLLLMIGTPADILDDATLYMKIIFCGLPFLTVFNFGSAILIAKGETKIQFVTLTMTGILNVILNVICVTKLQMGVEGVAIPTITAQFLSALIIISCLLRESGSYRLYPSCLKIKKCDIRKILAAGLPSGIQSSMFSISNVLLQSAINSFGVLGVAGSTAANNVITLLYMLLVTNSHAANIFCGQNYGAKKPKRIIKSILLCCATTVVIAIISGSLCMIFKKEIISVFVSEKDAVAFGIDIVSVVAPTYIIYGIMEVFMGALRAIDKPKISMVNSIVGVCGTRILWIYTYFKAHHYMRTLFFCYPLSWIVALILHAGCFMIFFARQKQKWELAGYV